MKIFLIGFMGSGKTHWGRMLSHKLGIPFFDLDEQIVFTEGKSINDLFNEKGEEHFRLLEKDALHIVTESHESFIMATGGGTPCYYQNIGYMNEKGTTVWLNTPAAVLFERLQQGRAHRPLVNKFEDEQLRVFIGKKLADRRLYYEQAKIIIQEDTVTLEEFIQTIFHA